MSHPSAPPPVLIKNVRVFDGVSDQLSGTRSVYLKDGLIGEEEEQAGPDAWSTAAAGC
ncbi:hypothetical protein [Streptomyces sp. NPDC005281]|uniref:hypothetical protein n=1 Tax=Streptomyces sp. NPDC005281 TaxID=3155712 RepID=UPI00339FFB23